jgi:hypothetical protein
MGDWIDSTGFGRMLFYKQQFMATIDGMDFFIYQHMHNEPDRWLLVCEAFRCYNQPLRATTVEEAKTAAIRLLVFYSSQRTAVLEKRLDNGKS